MNLTAIVLFLVCSACWMQTSNSQTDGPTETEPTERPDCSRGLGNLSPMIVPDLPVCEDIRGTPQCCARDYILQRLNITEEAFRMALREELQRRFDLFRNIAMRIRDFLEGGFLDGLFSSFADLSYLSDRSAVVGTFVRELRDHLDIDRDRDEREGRQFSVRDLLERLLNRVKEDAADQYGNLLGIQRCIRDLIQARVDEARMEAFAAAVEQVRRVRTTLDRLTDFLDSLNTTLAGYRPLQVCVNRLVELNDCDSCIVPRAALCFNWCGALARACYSPFYNNFNEQFMRFWRVARDLVGLIPDLLQTLNANRRIIRLSGLEFSRDAVRECSANITGSGLLGKRQTDDVSTPLLPSVPDFVTSRVADLMGGPFEYEIGGPRLCRFFRTSRLNCWDGLRERLADIQAFDVDGIDGQDENPAIQIPTSDLQAQASALTSSVDEFFDDTSFTDVTPDGLTVPGGGSVGLTVTISVILVGLLAALGIN